MTHLEKKKIKWFYPREDDRTDPISRFLATGSFLDRSSMTCQLTLYPFLAPASSLRPSSSRVLSGMTKGMVDDDASSRTMLSEGFKGTDENFRRGEEMDRGGKKPPVNFYHISESFVGLASAWPMPNGPREFSRYRAWLSSRPSGILSYRIPDFTVAFPNPVPPSSCFFFFFFSSRSRRITATPETGNRIRDAKFRVPSARGFPAIREESTKI